jgi:CxxC motif-containing protein
MKTLLCITCPNSCRLEVEEKEGVIKVTGNKCKRGIAFAEAEITNPTRTLTTTVRTAFREAPVLPVRTAAEIPKAKIRDLMAYINSITVSEHLGIGDIVAKNALGLGIDILATSNILREEHL